MRITSPGILAICAFALASVAAHAAITGGISLASWFVLGLTAVSLNFAVSWRPKR